ncbi:MAG: hypothetical protein ACRED0_08345, partial [Gammaproteobacteria bacterium]
METSLAGKVALVAGDPRSVTRDRGATYRIFKAPFSPFSPFFLKSEGTAEAAGCQSPASWVRIPAIVIA